MSRFIVQQVVIFGLGLALFLVRFLGILDEIYIERNDLPGTQSPLLLGYGVMFWVIGGLRIVARSAWFAGNRGPILRLAGRSPESLGSDLWPSVVFRWLLHIDRDGNDRDARR